MEIIRMTTRIIQTNRRLMTRHRTMPPPPADEPPVEDPPEALPAEIGSPAVARKEFGA